MNQTYKVGPSKSVKVYPGDKVDIEVWEYHEGNSGFGTTSTPLTTLVTMVAGAFGGVSGAGGDPGLIYSGVNSAINGFLPPGNQGSTRPAAYLNYILFDKNYKVLNMGTQLAPAATFTKQMLSFTTLNIKEAGYVFVYLSYDNDSNNWVYFDDLKVSHTKSNVLQYNEYYPFGLQASTSWTRDGNSNNFLYNDANELNQNSGWYETFFRGYDPTLGRFHQVDPLAHASSSHSPYSYAFNDPIFYNDPNGDYPREVLFDMERSGSSGQAQQVFGDEGGLLPGQSGGYSYYHPSNSIGVGSGSYWSDQYRSAEGNLALMSSSTFQNFYNVDLDTDEGKARAAQSMGTKAYFVTTDDGDYIYYDKSFQNIKGWYRAQATSCCGDAGEHNAFEKALIFINEFNPVANAWDALSGYANGTDRFGNPISQGRATFEAASVIPLGRVLGGLGKVGTLFMKYQGNFVLNTAWKNWGTYMTKQGWSFAQVEQTLLKGNWQSWTKNQNWLNPGNSMSIVTNPQTGQSLIIDNVTKEIIQLGKAGHAF
jgi:RHS repeat-associated protein